MTRPSLGLEFEPRFCANHVVDLTAGCSFGCVYCPFADLTARRRGVVRPTGVDMAPLAALPAPPTVFLSPGSDAFAPQAAERTHALLAHLLPRGTVVGIVTKGVIPERTLDLLGAHAARVEGVAIGLTSLDDHRNAVLEPGCPPASERLANLERVAARGLTAALRMDPLFPDLDDGPAALAVMVAEAACRGAYAVTATYLFAWGRYLRRLCREPLTADACALLTERAPMEGGTALSVPLARKLATYGRLAELAAARGLKFNTCGCKDLRVGTRASFSTRCRNTWFREGRSAAAIRSGARPAPVA